MKRIEQHRFVGQRAVMLVLAVLLAMPMSAQYYRNSRYTRHGHSSYHRSFSEVYYGLRLGVNVATVNSDDPFLDGGSGQTGLGVGMTIGFQLAPASPLYLETGLSYMEKGGEGRYQGSKFTYGLNYLEIPLVMKYAYAIDRDFCIQPFFGGYMAVGVSGKIKDFGVRKAYSSYDDEGFKRMDAGLRLGCGVQFDHLYAELGYDFGLANVCHDYFDTSHTGCFFANIGVNF